MSITLHAFRSRQFIPAWAYKILAQRWIDLKYPRHLFIETTADCNLDCPYCPREKQHDQMDPRLFHQIVDEASQYGPRSFSLHLFGEPLLYPHCSSAIRYIKAKNRRHTVLLTTNGCYLNGQAKELLKAGVDRIFWTWRPEAKIDEETLKLLKKSRKFLVRLIREITPKNEWDRWSKWPMVEKKLLHNYGGNIDLARFRTNGTPGLPERYPCYHLWLAPAVAWNGDILICCADPHHRSKLGQFPDMTVHEAWIGEALQELRRGHLTKQYSSICKQCDVWKTYPSMF